MMDDVPKPITVWMVHLERGGDLRETKGTLSLDETAIVFEERDGGTTRFPLGSVRRAKRPIGSPVMLVHWERDGSRRETAFYFTQPPPLPGRTDAEPTSGAELLRSPRPGLIGSARQPSKRRQRKQAMSYMTAHAGTSREAIRVWVQAISERTQPGR
jgi:hypothetical protein